MAARQPKFITQALAELRWKRPCKSCGRPFRPGRIDALTCSETCRWRRSHGQPDYIEALNTEQARHDARARHERIEMLIKDVKSYTAAERERRLDRRQGEAWIKAWMAVWDNPNITRSALIKIIREFIPDRPSIMADRVLRELRHLKNEPVLRIGRAVLDAVEDQLAAMGVPPNAPITPEQVKEAIAQVISAPEETTKRIQTMILAALHDRIRSPTSTLVSSMITTTPDARHKDDK